MTTGAGCVWSGLHEKRGADVPYEVIRACVHLERQQPLAALWPAWLPPTQLPNGMTLSVETLWQAYASRWPVESGIHFRKEILGWTRIRFQSREAGDRWTELTALTCWMLFLARAIVTDNPWLWQKAQLTPQRVQQSLRPIFALIGNPPHVFQSRAENHRAGRKAGVERRNHVLRWSKRLRRQQKRLDLRLVRF